MGFFLPIHWTEAGLAVSSDQYHAPDCTVRRPRGGQSQLSDDKKVSMPAGLLWHVCPGPG